MDQPEDTHNYADGWLALFCAPAGSPRLDFDGRMIAASREIPDLIQTLTQSQMLIHQCVFDYLADEDIGPYALYCLTRWPHYATRLGILPPELALEQAKRLVALLAAVYQNTALRSIAELQQRALTQWVPPQEEKPH